MLNEERELRKWSIHINGEKNIGRYFREITGLVRAVREDCIAAYHDYLARPTKFNGISFEDALRKGMRWRKAAIRGKK